MCIATTGNRIHSACKEPCSVLSQNLQVLKFPSKSGPAEAGVSFWFLSDILLLLCEMDSAGQTILLKKMEWFAPNWQLFIRKVP